MKTVMILGGAKGVGREILNACLEKGYNVSFCGRDAREGKEIIQASGKADRLYFHPIDLNSIGEIENFHRETLRRFTKVDALVVYAGITPVASLTDTDEEVFDSVFNVNLKAPYFLLKHVVKSMMEQNSGSIIFFGSAHMDYGEMDRTAYALTKSSLYTLSTHISHHYARHGIRSNYVVMGWTDTEGELKLRASEGKSESELKREASAAIPMGRMLSKQDPVPAVMYLISEESCMTTGSLIRITGGEYI
ncbi:SDR family NAD(P)-dependent oxidoreductase [Robiginitalea biformata]|uniref:SDR family NAD(P)-dependent oxidoreductase n=1 Tax=Robiginitalea biformata TaxID=252307 RepID=UPI003B59A903